MKVCILAAGMGTRIRSFGGALHKALLPVGNTAVISRIMAQFPADAEFVIAVGHLEEQIRDYIAVAHSDRSVAFVSVRPYEGPGAGPGRSLWSCRTLLDEPFYLTACDTLISTPVPPLDANFMGTQPVDDPLRWCTLEVDDARQVKKLHYKTAEGTRLGFVGFAGIVDVVTFWRGLGAHLGRDEECQVNDGFEALTSKKLVGVDVGWIDVGTEDNYHAALPLFEKNYTFYGKSTDVTYRIGDRIIKFFSDKELTRSRFRRGRENPVFAEVLDMRGGFFSYRFAEGRLLSRLIGSPAYRRVTEWLEADFWRDMPVDRAVFDAACKSFYVEKTAERLAAYEARFSSAAEGRILTLNGISCRPVRQAIADLPEDFLVGGIPSTYHGDLHDENILVRPNGTYVLIDWRQDFAGLPTVGDRYYDLAKFFHTLDLSVETMDKGAFRSEWTGTDQAIIEHDEGPCQAQARSDFWQFVLEAGYDRRRVELLNGLIFINMAPLYERDMADYLYLLGRLRLEQALRAPPVAQAPARDRRDTM